MRHSVTVRLPADILAAARAKAAESHRTLTDYIETLMKRDLRQGDANIEVVAPADIRDYAAVPLPDETEDERERRDALFHAVLNEAGY
jgi:hypothetical protein